MRRISIVRDEGTWTIDVSDVLVRALAALRGVRPSDLEDGTIEEFLVESLLRASVRQDGVA